MQLRPSILAAAAALCLAGSAHATVVNFDNPGLIAIGSMTGVATYTESGYMIQGQAADFLLQDGAEVATGTFNLGASTTTNFGTDWARLTQLSFLASSGFSLDNINVAAVPEPGTLALVGLAVAGLTFTRRRTGDSGRSRNAAERGGTQEATP